MHALLLNMAVLFILEPWTDMRRLISTTDADCELTTSMGRSEHGADKHRRAKLREAISRSRISV